MLKIKIIPCLKDNFSFVIYNKINRNSLVIDPGEVEPIIFFIKKNNLNLNYILNTHHHSDHIGGNLELKKKYSLKIVGSKMDKTRIPGIDITLNDGDVWNFENSEIEVRETPGHTIGHIYYYLKKENALFTGDTLFSFGCGRLFEGTYENMLSSLKLIKSLPHNTKIYCGHEYTLNNIKFCLSLDKENKILKKTYDKIKKKIDLNIPSIPTTLNEQISNNIFLNFDNIELKKKLKFENLDELNFFKKIRELKDQF